MSRSKYSVIFFALPFLAQLAFADNPKVSAEGKPDDDTYFMQFVKENGKIDYPYSELERKIMQFVTAREHRLKMNDPSLGTFFASQNDFSTPDGRNLQRNKSDFARPRRVLDTSSSLFPSSQASVPKLFVAHAPNSHQIEVQSWNPKTLQFDFLIVENYGPDKDFQVENANRPLCLQCHQNGAGILTHFPWAETSFNQNVRDKIHEARTNELSKAQKEFQDAVQKAQKQDLAEHAKGHYDFVHDAILNKPAPSERELFDQDPSNNFSGDFGQNLFQIDRAIRDANHHVQAVNVCKNLCGDDLKCRRMLIGLALLGNHSGVQSDGLFQQKMNKIFAEAMKAKWPKDGFGYASSVIPDRDPLLLPEKGGVTSVFAATDKDEFNQRFPVSSASGTPGIQVQLDGSLAVDGKKESVPFQASAKVTQIGSAFNLPVPARTESNDDLLTGKPILQYSEDPRLVTTQFTSALGIKDYRISGLKPGSYSDPARARPLVQKLNLETAAGSLMSFMGTCFGIDGKDIEEINKASPQRVEKIAFEPNSLDSLAGSWPAKNADIMQAFRTELAADYARDAEQLSDDIAPVSGVAEQAGQLAELSSHIQAHLDPSKLTEAEKESTTLKLTEKYCATCHLNKKSGAPAVPVNDFKGLKTFEGEFFAGSRPVDYLKANLMPPEKAKLQPSDEERAFLIKVLDDTAIAAGK